VKPPDPISRLNGALEGRYRNERELGEGGMATVYLADDLKHERKVALKVLKPELAAVVGAARFLAEIKTTANLQHPHILPLHDSGEADGFLYYVMPYIEGETLRDRLEREKQLPVHDAVRIATDVAEALHAAHEQGVIHRDIKPANILMSKGRPLVADFGIALAVSQAGGGRLTETGLSMGTPYYMSPEQASADREPAAVSDVYSLGCVLYEMLVGEPPYVGSSAQAVLAKILTGDAPTATAARPSIPANVDAAIRKALEKLPADRFTGAQDFAKALADPGFRHGESGERVSEAAQGPWKRVSMVASALALTLAVGLGWSLLRPEPPARVARFSSPFLEGQAPIGPMEITPDGSALVYTGPDASGTGGQLWIRRWENLSATPIPGTEGARTPGLLGETGSLAQLSFSPDGREVAFTLGSNSGPLRVVPLGGGQGRTLVEAASAVGGWGEDGWIYFQTLADAIRRTSETGGEPEVLTELADGEVYHAFPRRLPGGRALLFQVLRTADGTDAEIWSLDLETSERTMLVRGSSPRYVASGHLLFGTPDGRLMAAAFDVDRAALVGNAVAVAEGLATDPLRNHVIYTVSDDGTLVYRAGGARDASGLQFVWVTRSGQATPVDPGHTFVSAETVGWRLSPDDDMVVFSSLVDGNEDVRIKHLPNGPEERITFSEDVDVRPSWTPDGQNVMYFSGPLDYSDMDVWSRRADGTGDRVLVLDAGSFAQGSSSADGEWLVLRTGATVAMGLGVRDIMAFRPGVDSAAVPLVASPDFNEGSPSLSPDGAWLAYTSDETGRSEVFIRPFPDVESARLRVSTDGGDGPVWAKSGRELFFVSPGRGLVTARFDPASGRVVARETLFALPTGVVGPAEASGTDFYDVSSGGERFLMARSYRAGEDETDAIGYVLVQNFFEELKRLVPN
jgi:serine/threonine-protein kinase